MLVVAVIAVGVGVHVGVVVVVLCVCVFVGAGVVVVVVVGGVIDAVVADVVLLALQRLFRLLFAVSSYRPANKYKATQIVSMMHRHNALHG